MTYVIPSQKIGVNKKYNPSQNNKKTKTKKKVFSLGKLPLILDDLNRELDKVKLKRPVLNKIKVSLISITNSLDRVSLFNEPINRGLPQNFKSFQQSLKSIENIVESSQINKIPSKKNTGMPVVEFRPLAKINAKNPSSIKNQTREQNSKTCNKNRRICTKEEPCELHRILRRLRAIANRIHEKRKIFTVYGDYSTIRAALLRRGWMEKFPFNYKRNIQKLRHKQILLSCKPGNEYEQVAISKLMRNYSTNFIWQPVHLKHEKTGGNPFRNRITRGKICDFTKKTGLIECINNSHWYSDHYDVISAPRSFYMDTEAEIRDFQNDYRITTCLGILSFIARHSTNSIAIFDTDGTISVNLIMAAIKNVRKGIMRRRKFDLEEDMYTSCTVEMDPLTWEKFQLDCEEIITYEKKFQTSNVITGKYLIAECIRWINEAKKCYPLLRSEGWHNMWLIKPAFLSRGRGIIIRRKYSDIIGIIKGNPLTKYIVQKYIERPLLIYKTKFDIRQYFLMVMHDNKFCLWMYKDSYLKFSSQQFDLHSFDASVHLTNHSVQKHYKNGPRSPLLPEHNMWSSNEFNEYLKSIGENESTWNNIYNSMKNNIILVVLSSITETVCKPNTFELFGCDFIIDEYFNPVLIEINATPDMAPSTKVTANLCPRVLDDVIKVVLDYKFNLKAPVGRFEKIYEYQLNDPKSGINLIVEGKKKPIENTVVEENNQLKLVNKKTVAEKEINSQLKLVNKKTVPETEIKSVVLYSNREEDVNSKVEDLYNKERNYKNDNNGENKIENNIQEKLNKNYTCQFIKRMSDQKQKVNQILQDEIITNLIKIIENNHLLITLDDFYIRTQKDVKSGNIA